MNIVLITLDDASLFATQVGDPNLIPDFTGKLAERGASFSCAVAAANHCKPGRTAMFAGAWPHQTGVYSNHIADLQRLPDGFAWPSILRAAGYSTIHLGKEHTAYPLEELGFDRVNNSTANLIENADEFLRSAEAQQAPFLLSLSTSSPHHPWSAGPAWMNAYSSHSYGLRGNVRTGPDSGKPAFHSQLAASSASHAAQRYGTTDPGEITDLYFAETAEILHNLERLWNTLKNQPYADQTAIILTSDNGQHFGNHGIWYKGATGYEEMIKVPLVVLWPGVTAAGHVSDVPVSLVDLGATVLDVLGLGRPKGCQGVSFRQALAGDPMPSKRFTIVESARDSDGGHTRALLPARNAISPGTWKLVLNEADLPELYELERDPWERDNVFAQEIVVSAEMTREIEDWCRAVGDGEAVRAFF